MEGSFSSSDTSPVVRIVEAVASHAGNDPLDLPPLYGAIDADAVESLFHEGSDGSVRFRYAGREVTLHSEGSVEVTCENCCDVEVIEAPADD